MACIGGWTKKRIIKSSRHFPCRVGNKYHPGALSVAEESKEEPFLQCPSLGFWAIQETKELNFRYSSFREQKLFDPTTTSTEGEEVDKNNSIGHNN